MILTNTAETALTELSTAPIVRFSLLALSSIFFLVDPFAAIPSFLAITESADPARRHRMARKGALTCFIVLTGFAVAGQLIFRMFGITLPAFEIAGGLILMLIGLDMLQARRSPTQETHGDTVEAAAKEDAGIVPLGIPMLAGPGAISSVMVLVGQAPSLWHWEMAAILGSLFARSMMVLLTRCCCCRLCDKFSTCECDGVTDAAVVDADVDAVAAKYRRAADGMRLTTDSDAVCLVRPDCVL